MSLQNQSNQKKTYDESIFKIDELDMPNWDKRCTIYTFKKYRETIINKMIEEWYNILSESGVHPLRQIKFWYDYDITISLIKDWPDTREKIRAYLYCDQ